MDYKIASAEVKYEDLVVTWSDEKQCKYPMVWLRDNCQCPNCFSPTAKSRVMLLSTLDVEVRATNHIINNDGQIEITWDDGHESCFESSWLRSRCFTPAVRKERREFYRLEPKTWGASIKDWLPKITFDQLLEDDDVLYKWLCTLECIGICLVTGAPTEPGQLKRIGQRVAYLRKTNYGETFTVKSKMNPQNAAYTGAPLGLHTDLAYFNYQPGMQMLHCIRQVPMKGGENQFSDGFNAALQLKEKHPYYFELLSKIVVDFYDVGVDGGYHFHQMNRMPIISHDREGNLECISFSNHGRDSYLNVPQEQIKPFYRALKTYNDLLYAKENVLEIKLDDGDIICFHNYRTLHGRSGWEMAGNGVRHLEGGYIDWDEMRSCRRVLQGKYNEIKLLTDK